MKRLQPADGTAIGEGLYPAIEVLEAGAADSVKAIVLLSDGASNEGRDPRRAADAAKEAGIPVFTVGIGTTGGRLRRAHPAAHRRSDGGRVPLCSRMKRSSAASTNGWAVR